MTSIARVVLLALLASFASASSAADDDAAVIAQLTKQAAQWDRDLVAKDRDGVARNMAADFEQIRGSGAIVDRATFIADVLADGFRMDPYVVEDFRVKRYGDTALLYGRIRITGVDQGERYTTHFRYIDTYVRRDGEWKVVSVQITPMKD